MTPGNWLTFAVLIINAIWGGAGMVYWLKARRATYRTALENHRRTMTDGIYRESARIGWEQGIDFCYRSHFFGNGPRAYAHLNNPYQENKK